MKAKPSTFDVWVTGHARDQARDRCPGFKAAGIIDEVRAAIVAGRLGKEKPAGIAGRPSSRCLYAWTEDVGRCYVLQADIARFIVLTVLTPSTA